MIDDVDKLFFGTYGTTTLAQVNQALSEGKLPIIKSGDKTCVYFQTTASAHYFGCVYQNGGISYNLRLMLTVVGTGNWSSANIRFEDGANKTDVLSASSTNTEYPSAKAVWDLVDTTVGNVVSIWRYE